MLGTFMLGVLVICIVILFTTLAFNINTEKKTEQATITQPEENFYFKVSPDFHTTGCSIYFNDSLLFSGTLTSDTILSVGSIGNENAIIVVDHSTDQIQIVDVPKKQGTFRISQDKNELHISEE